MTTAAAPPDISAELVASTIERWSQVGPTDQEKLELLEGLNKTPGHGEKIKEEFKSLASRRLKADQDLVRLRLAIFTFIGGNEAQYPSIAPFAEDWHGYVDDWRRISYASEKIAEVNAYEYEHFARLLKEISDDETSGFKRRMLADRLKEFAKSEQFKSPVNLKEETLNLQQKLDTFRENCRKCVSQRSEEANDIIRKIDALKEKIQTLDGEIIMTGLSLGMSIGPLFLLAGVVEGTVLALLINERVAKRRELDGFLDQLNGGRFELPPFSEIEAQLASLDLLSIAEGFTVFLNISGSWRRDALDFAEALEKSGTLPELTKNQIELALSISGPYVEGLKQYAASIE